jgi:adenylate kinase family enzyme
MLTHHSTKDYKEAASEAAKKARIKMEELIHNGGKSAEAVIESVQNMIIKDRISDSNKIQFIPVGADSIDVYLKGLKEIYNLHPFALTQSLLRSGIPNVTKFQALMFQHGEVGNKLLAHNLNILFKESDKTNLIRVVEDEVRGVLSDRFRRMDARPLLEKFVEGCQVIGVRPIEGFVEDTRVVLRAVLPVVFEPIDNEVMIFGYEWRTSDFGHGAHCMNMWMKRLWCTNHAILDELLRQIHLGKRLDQTINLSETTVNLNTQATASQLYDTVVHMLSPHRVKLYLDGIRELDKEKVTSHSVNTFLEKKFAKLERERIIEQFNTADIEMMPKGSTKWRLSNAISWVANEIDNMDRKLYYQETAGNMIPRYEKIEPVTISPIE